RHVQSRREIASDGRAELEIDGGLLGGHPLGGGAELLDVHPEDPPGLVLRLDVDELGAMSTNHGLDHGAQPLSIDQGCALRCHYSVIFEGFLGCFPRRRTKKMRTARLGSAMRQPPTGARTIARTRHAINPPSTRPIRTKEPQRTGAIRRNVETLLLL